MNITSDNGIDMKKDKNQYMKRSVEWRYVLSKFDETLTVNGNIIVRERERR